MLYVLCSVGIYQFLLPVSQACCSLKVYNTPVIGKMVFDDGSDIALCSLGVIQWVGFTRTTAYQGLQPDH